MRILSILILLVMLFKQTPMNQLSKLTVLAEHYYEHKESNRNLNLIEFLAIHYTHGDVADADHDKDMKLPFKQFSPTSLIFTFTEFHDYDFAETNDIPDVLAAGALYKSPFHTSESLSVIWQPPKA